MLFDLHNLAPLTGDEDLDQMGLCEHSQITKICLSDGCAGETIPMTDEIWVLSESI